jgi:hypothetical protein
MVHFELGRRFDRILIPYSGIYCLLSERDCSRCLACAARHLAPDGRLIFDAYRADAFHAESDPRDHRRESLERVDGVEHRGVFYDVFERSRWRRASQRMDVIYEYVPRTGETAVRGAIAHRYLLSHQIEGLLARAGLRLLRLLRLEGDYRGGGLEANGELLVAIAEVAGPPSRRPDPATPPPSG